MLSIGFNHRPNADGSVNSICLQCFLIVASGNDDATLAGIEGRRRCDPADLARLRGFAPKSPSNLR
jgi:hypothetical protein